MGLFRGQAAITLSNYANRTARDLVNFAGTPPGFRTNADGQHVAGHTPERPGSDRELRAGTLGPIFARGRGLDTGGIAALMACGTFGGFLMATWLALGPP